MSRIVLIDKEIEFINSIGLSTDLFESEDGLIEVEEVLGDFISKKGFDENYKLTASGRLAMDILHRVYNE